jgi:predicted nucleic acid-binding protein
MRYVVDASVILKWVLGDEQEADHAKALDLLEAWADGSAELAAPALWQYEVGNFLGRERHEEAIDKMDSLLKLRIQTVELTDTMIRRCFTWMKQYGVTFCDSSYLAAALEIQAILTTADEKFATKMGKAGAICLVGDLEL